MLVGLNVKFTLSWSPELLHLLEKAWDAHWITAVGCRVHPTVGCMMKGLLKGLRQISNMFDAKEPEMQIGHPTDVKHVAHIGWDGPTVNSPSWMNEFRSTNAHSVIGNVNTIGNELSVSPQLSSRGPTDFLVEGTSQACSSNTPPRPSRRNATRDVQNGESEPSAVPKHSRRHQSHSDSRAGGEPSEGSRRGRRERRTSEGSSGGSDSSASSTMQDGPGAPKQPRRRKGKGVSSSEGSVRRSKGATTDQGSSLKPVVEDTTEGQQC